MTRKETVIIRSGSYMTEIEVDAFESLPLYKSKRLFKLLKEGENTYWVNTTTKKRLAELLRELCETRRVELRDARVAYLCELSNDSHTKAQRDRISKKLAGETKKAETKYNKALKLNSAFHEITD